MTQTNESFDECRLLALQAKNAAGELRAIDVGIKNDWLRASAERIGQEVDSILAANRLDLDAAEANSVSNAMLDRLRLSEASIQSIAEGLCQVAELPDPLDRVFVDRTRTDGLRIRKIAEPLGVIFFIFESRPNVTVDAAALCIKSGNCVILRGGKEAKHSSRRLIELMSDTAVEFGIPKHAFQLVATESRAAVDQLLAMPDCIDLVIPRGGRGLIERVTSQAQMPVLKHFDGNCHIYVDQNADLTIAKDVVVNSKCHRIGVCNACESLLVHNAIKTQFLPRIAKEFAVRGIEMRCCPESHAICKASKLATDEDHRTEFLAPVISIRVVDDLDDAIQWINKHGSRHTDGIVSTDQSAIERFCLLVDSSAVMVNASTRFNDGFEFGLGAEIGISTDKLHARGPCGLEELTTYKYIVVGNGHVRS